MKKLSKRQLEITKLSAVLTAQQIADKLGLSRRTVQNIQLEARRKVGVNKTTDLVAVMAERGRLSS